MTRVAIASVVTAAFMVAVVVAATAALGASAGLANPDVPFRAFVALAFGNWSFLLAGWSAIYVGVHLGEHKRPWGTSDREGALFERRPVS